MSPCRELAGHDAQIRQFGSRLNGFHEAKAAGSPRVAVMGTGTPRRPMDVGLMKGRRLAGPYRARGRVAPGLCRVEFTPVAAGN